MSKTWGPGFGGEMKAVPESTFGGELVSKPFQQPTWVHFLHFANLCFNCYCVPFVLYVHLLFFARCTNFCLFFSLGTLLFALCTV